MHRVIALDAMGSDRAPKPEIEGAIQASRRFGIHVALVGPEETLQAALSRHPFSCLIRALSGRRGRLTAAYVGATARTRQLPVGMVVSTSYVPGSTWDPAEVSA